MKFVIPIFLILSLNLYTRPATSGTPLFRLHVEQFQGVQMTDRLDIFHDDQRRASLYLQILLDSEGQREAVEIHRATTDGTKLGTLLLVQLVALAVEHYSPLPMYLSESESLEKLQSALRSLGSLESSQVSRRIVGYSMLNFERLKQRAFQTAEISSLKALRALKERVLVFQGHELWQDPVPLFIFVAPSVRRNYWTVEVRAFGEIMRLPYHEGDHMGPSRLTYAHLLGQHLPTTLLLQYDPITRKLRFLDGIGICERYLRGR